MDYCGTDDGGYFSVVVSSVFPEHFMYYVIVNSSSEAAVTAPWA